jgi:hypothetical protein
LRLDELEPQRRGEILEQGKPRAKCDRLQDEPGLVDQSESAQRLGEGGAAPGEQVLTGLLLERCDDGGGAVSARALPRLAFARRVMSSPLERRWLGVKLRITTLAIGVLVAGCGGSTALSTMVAPARHSAVAASCAAVSAAQQFAMARLVFVGRMLPGSSTALDGRRVLGSPAMVEVVRYLKGSGPRRVKVTTAATITNEGVTVGEDGIEPQVGEIWKIYTGSRHEPFDTSICGGSRRVRSVARVALGLWSGFPVQANPRPVVPLGEGVVLDPRTGFPDDSTKIAFGEGRFTLKTALPTGAVTAGRLSAAGAYKLLRSSGRSSAIKVAPLKIRSVRLGIATFVTDRGRQRLPAWQFWFKRVAKPASVLALAPPDLFTPPRLQQLGQVGTGSSIDGAATADRSGREITISFIGAHAGNRPCDAGYSATAVADRRAVAFTIRTIPVPAPPNTICTAVGYTRTAVLHLVKPLGARVLISSTDGGAVPVTYVGR